MYQITRLNETSLMLFIKLLFFGLKIARKIHNNLRSVLLYAIEDTEFDFEDLTLFNFDNATM